MSGQSVGQLSYVYDLFRGMDDYSINQLYHGDFSTTVTDNILSAVETCLSSINDDVKLRKRLYFLTVESLQNITRHEEKVDPLHKGNCFFLLQGTGSLFYITSGNYIANERVQKLQSRLEVVNGLDTESLRAYAKELMEAGGYSGRGGAGLGLIEMARKSEHKLQYSFVKFNDKVSYFYFQIKVNLSAQEPSTITAQDAAVFTNAQLIHQVTYNYKLDSICSGALSESKLELLKTVLKYSFNIMATTVTDTLFFDTAAALANNIIKHGVKLPGNVTENSKRGIFIVQRERDHLNVITGNWVTKNNQQLTELQQQLITGKTDKLGRLSAIYKALSGKLKCELIITDEACDFFIINAKISYL
jgi:hypothetical protein